MKYFAVITMLTISIVGCLTPKSQAREADIKSDIKNAAVVFNATFKDRINEISDTYKKGYALQHLKMTMSTLRLVNRASIRALFPAINSLEKSISKDGLMPYISISIEIAHRLGRNRHPVMQKQYSSLATASLNNLGKISVKNNFSVVIKNKHNKSYRKYDEHTGRAVARLAFSEFGRQQYQIGQTPSDLVRTAAMFWNCKSENETKSRLTDVAHKDCLRFVDAVTNRFKQSGQGNQLPEMMADFRHPLKGPCQ